MLENVRSLNTEQRGEVYRRIFQHPSINPQIH